MVLLFWSSGVQSEVVKSDSMSESIWVAVCVIVCTEAAGVVSGVVRGLGASAGRVGSTTVRSVLGFDDGTDGRVVVTFI